ncbi:YceD family protein [Streptomonospora algeriensis]|uniref:YceD family protein n=1 Tax=Streptomonospora algeriensis TaxID=995084 RepID=A0ABW3BHE2_9ACTN
MVDTRPLGRQPGSMRTVQRSVPAPAQLATAMARVPEGTQIELDLRLEAVMEGVLATGRARVDYEAECSRCLDPIQDTAEASFQELFRYPGEDGLGPEDTDTEDEEEDYYLEGELLDLEQVVRDAVVLTLPLSPLCREDCPGLCVECGVKLADAGPEHGHGEGIDPRWEALRNLGEEFGDR